MKQRDFTARYGFWLLALLWLPVGIATTGAGRFAVEAGVWVEPVRWLVALIASADSLIVVAPSGLPLALACRRLWRAGHRWGASTAGIGLGAATVVAALVAGLLGPFAIAACAAALSLPAWIAVWRLVGRS